MVLAPLQKLKIKYEFISGDATSGYILKNQ
jgi:hypothetical protein